MSGSGAVGRWGGGTQVALPHNGQRMFNTNQNVSLRVIGGGGGGGLFELAAVAPHTFDRMKNYSQLKVEVSSRE